MPQKPATSGRNWVDVSGTITFAKPVTAVDFGITISTNIPTGSTETLESLKYELDVVQTPEPGTMVLFGSGLLAFMAVVRRHWGHTKPDLRLKARFALPDQESNRLIPGEKAAVHRAVSPKNRVLVTGKHNPMSKSKEDAFCRVSR